MNHYSRVNVNVNRCYRSGIFNLEVRLTKSDIFISVLGSSGGGGGGGVDTAYFIKGMCELGYQGKT